MKKYFAIVSISILSLVSCNCATGEAVATEENSAENVTSIQEPESEPAETYAFFGDTISPDGAISGEELLAKYKSMEETDTVEVKFAGVIQNVCKKKGCWMNVALNDEERTFIKFKDYSFFMPLNAQESNVIVNGKAFVSLVTIDELKHYAEDDGKTQEEIDAITEPEITYSFLADGVLIEE